MLPSHDRAGLFQLDRGSQIQLSISMTFQDMSQEVRQIPIATVGPPQSIFKVGGNTGISNLYKLLEEIRGWDLTL